jgi:hypothetical protein
MGRNTLRGHCARETPGRPEAVIEYGAVQRDQGLTLGVAGSRQPESAAGQGYGGGAVLNERTSVDHVGPSQAAARAFCYTKV